MTDFYATDEGYKDLFWAFGARPCTKGLIRVWPVPTHASTRGRAAHARHGASHTLRNSAVVLVVAVLIAVLLRAYVVETYFIPSGSMEPTLQVGDRILVDKLAYHLHSVGRGDIVVFARPPKENCPGPAVPDLVKRVIGLPGETISLSGGGHVLIDGRPLDESWLPASQQGTTFPGPAGTPYNLVRPYKVPSGNYVVMGDNRGDSCDSRYWGPVPKNLIVGKVDVRIWPLSAIRFF
jgi:signal peptidase I